MQSLVAGRLGGLSYCDVPIFLKQFSFEQNDIPNNELLLINVFVCVYISHVGIIIEAHSDTYGIRCFFTIGSRELFYFEGKMFKPEVMLKIKVSLLK